MSTRDEELDCINYLSQRYSERSAISRLLIEREEYHHDLWLGDRYESLLGHRSLSLPSRNPYGD